MFTDPISDMLTRIRNAALAQKYDTVMPYSKFKFALANLLVEQGFISKAVILDGKFKTLQLILKYSQNGESVITGINRVSTPGQRIYLPVEKLPRTNSGFGITIISTPKGLLTDKEARKQHLGGEIVCQVW